MKNPGESAAERLSARVPMEAAGRRLDQVLAELFPDYSRSRLQQWIKEGRLQVDGRSPKARDKVLGGEQVELALPDGLAEDDQRGWQGEAIPLDIVYEDSDLLVINKPAGRVVHPAAGNRAGTLVNALLHHVPELNALPRAGIIHRLDKDTSGLLVVPRTLPAHTRLSAELQAREFKREYEAVSVGVMTAGGTVDAPMGRHPVDRKRMAVVQGGKPAVTHYRVIQRFRAHTHVRVNLETGRTHQIRVHLAHVGYPLVGDPVYGRRLVLPPAASESLKATLRGFKRQALHAARLGLTHPTSGQWMEWAVPPPPDMRELLQQLTTDAETHAP